MRIKQRKDDCHYETIIEENKHLDGYMPIVIGYGFSQESADEEALKKLVGLIK